MTANERRDLLQRIIESGYQISPDALDLILDQDSPSEIVDSIILSSSSSIPSILSRDFVQSLFATPLQEDDISLDVHDMPDEDDTPEEKEEDGPEPSGLSREFVQSLSAALVQEDSTLQDIYDTDEPSVLVDDGSAEWTIRVRKNPDFNSVGSEGTVDDFLNLFTDRYNRIKSIFQRRVDTSGAVSPAVAKLRTVDIRRQRALRKEGIYTRIPSQVVLGMVKSKRVSVSGNVLIELEDADDTLLCVVPIKAGIEGLELAEKGNSLLVDEVVCLRGYVDQDKKMIARDVLFPDVPTARYTGRARRDVHAIFLSDLHVGSQEFLHEEFSSFLDWIRGIDVPDEEKLIVDSVRYLFIAGDLIDGIGVYPGQKIHLLLPDIYDQYAQLVDLLKKVPDTIKIICIPGNHDACRQALPKPPIPEEFAESLYGLGNQILMLGDPSQVQVEGVSILLTHGDSQDDLVTTLPGVSYKNPAASMKALLRKRHLAPIYGGKTELAPLRRDWMVIDHVPDIVHFGHAHHNAVDNYRGIQIINSGTFQAQTDFMKKQGVDPTPGIVTYVNLRTREPGIKMFYDFSVGLT